MYGNTTMHQARLTAEQKMRGKTLQDEIFADRGSGRRQGRPGRFVFELVNFCADRASEATCLYAEFTRTGRGQLHEGYGH